jgi:dTDP-4-dehydrorhamnose 3,5-epimerase
VKVTPTALPEVLHVEPKVFGDARGFFLETYAAPRYHAAGMTMPFVQDNLSYSRKGVLRGLHFQNPNAQGKLVQAVAGEVFDVAVDVRVGSPRFGQWVGMVLSAAARNQLYIPPGFAHGFLVVSDEALFMYKCTALYHPASERTIRWNDPAIAIEWPMRDIVVSERDGAARGLGELASEQLPTYD